MAVVPAPSAVVAAVVAAAVLPGVLRMAVVLPAAGAAAAVVASFTAAVLVAAAVLSVVPFSHFLPLLAPLGLLPAAAPPPYPPRPPELPLSPLLLDRPLLLPAGMPLVLLALHVRFLLWEPDPLFVGLLLAIFSIRFRAALA